MYMCKVTFFLRITTLRAMKTFPITLHEFVGFSTHTELVIRKYVCREN